VAISPGVKWLGYEAHHHLLLRSRMVEVYLHSPVCLHGIVLHSLSTGTTLLLPSCHRHYVVLILIASLNDQLKKISVA
jgi:hypothetical protein